MKAIPISKNKGKELVGSTKNTDRSRKHIPMHRNHTNNKKDAPKIEPILRSVRCQTLWTDTFILWQRWNVVRARGHIANQRKMVMKDENVKVNVQFCIDSKTVVTEKPSDVPTTHDVFGK